MRKAPSFRFPDSSRAKEVEVRTLMARCWAKTKEHEASLLQAGCEEGRWFEL